MVEIDLALPVMDHRDAQAPGHWGAVVDADARLVGSRVAALHLPPCRLLAAQGTQAVAVTWREPWLFRRSLLRVHWLGAHKSKGRAVGQLLAQGGFPCEVGGTVQQTFKL